MARLSSYSHLESGLEELGDYVNHVTSNVYFVDLAGSERLSDVGYSYLGVIFFFSFFFKLQLKTFSIYLTVL